MFHAEESEANLLVSLLHFLKFMFVYQCHRRRIENHFLLVHQVAGIVYEFPLLGNEFLFLVFGEQCSRFSDDVAHQVVERPHHGGRAREALLFQHGVELVLLPLVVQRILTNLVV